MRKEQIIFDNLHKVSVPSGAEENFEVAATVNKNLSAFGYTLDEVAFKQLATASLFAIQDFWIGLTELIKNNTNFSKFDSQELFYPNFPEEVMSKDEAELYINALIYYFATYGLGTDGKAVRDMLVDEKEERPELIEFTERKLQVISCASETELEDLMFARICGTVMSSHKEDELCEFAKIYPEDFLSFFEREDLKFKSKENLVKVSTLLYSMGNTEIMKKFIRDTSDVLRIIAGLSNINIGSNVNKINLAMKPKEFIIKLDKDEKKLVKELLNNCPRLYDDIWREKDLWKKVMRYIGFTKKTPERVAGAFKNLATNNKVSENGRKLESNYAKVLRAVEELRKGNMLLTETIAENLPGFFIANFLRFMDNAKEDSNKIALGMYISRYCSKVPVVDLLKLKNLINLRDDWDKLVYINAKGTAKAIENNKAPISDILKSMYSSHIDIAISESLLNADRLGKVYIDPELSNLKMPLRAERDASDKALLTKYSKIELDETKNLLAFAIYWKDKLANPTDIDLSVVGYNENFEAIGRVSYSHLRDSWAAHSGDYTTAPEGAMEMIVCDKAEMRKAGIRYLIPSIHGFNCPFDETEKVSFITMQKEGAFENITESIVDQGSNKNGKVVFLGKPVEISQIENPIDIGGKVYDKSPALFDIENNCYIWIDSVLRFEGIQNIENPEGMKIRECILYKALNNEYPSMYQFIEQHAFNRGVITTDITEADLIFTAGNKELTKLIKKIDETDEADEAEKQIKEDAKVITSFEMDKITNL